MGNKDKSVKRHFKKKKVSRSNRYTTITTTSATSSTPVLAGTTSICKNIQDNS